MSFLVLFLFDKSIFAHLWLFVAVLGLGWTEDVPKNSELTEVLRLRRTSSSTASSCVVPRQPINGEWKLHRLYCDENVDCDVPQGFGAPIGSRLIYSCNPGYRLETDIEVYCTPKGSWSLTPECIEIRCNSLNSVSRITTCYRSGKDVDCDSSVLPETRALVSCRPGYRKDTALVWKEGEDVICKKNGQWEPKPIECSPGCGVTKTRKPELALGTKTVENGNDFPWHAYLFVDVSPPGVTSIFRKCGATLIRADLILTSATCVYNETAKATMDPRRLFILPAGGIPVADYPKLDFQSIKKNAVKSVHVPCNYPGFSENEAANIALLELKQPFVLSSDLLPACVDDPGHSEQILKSGAYGRIPATETAKENYKGMIYTATAPYLPLNQIEALNSSDRNLLKGLIRNDTFFTDGLNGSRDYKSLTGSGVVFKENDRWYVMGIHHVALTDDEDTSEDTDKALLALYHTKVSYHVPWILNLIWNLQRQESQPPCKRKTSPVRTTIAMPTSSAMPGKIGRSNLTHTVVTCLVPPQPDNGEWKFVGDECRNKMGCKIGQDTLVKPGEHLIYSCVSGYRLRGSSDIYCSERGSWSSIPICTEAVPGLGPAENIPENSQMAVVVLLQQGFYYPGEGLPCLVPSQPTNGHWRLHRQFCDFGLDCSIPQGIELQYGSRLVYSCDSGYRVEGNINVQCTARGKWSAIPNCIQYIETPPPLSHCLLWGQPVSTRDDYTYTPGVGRHKLHTRAVVWNEARMTCEEEGGHLAIINSIAEGHAIFELFRNSEPITGSPHPDFASIGFHDLYSEGQFVTIHGQSLARAGFTLWLDGQPDNAGGAENCGSFHKTGRLNDINCGTKFGFICEIPMH